MPILGKGKKDDPLAYLQQGKFKEAIKLLEARLQKDPQNFPMKVKLAEAYEGDNRKADAAKIYLKEGEERLAEGARSDGLAFLKKAARLAPGDESIRAHIAKLERADQGKESETGSFSFDVSFEDVTGGSETSPAAPPQPPPAAPPPPPAEKPAPAEAEAAEEATAKEIPAEPAQVQPVPMPVSAEAVFEMGPGGPADEMPAEAVFEAPSVPPPPAPPEEPEKTSPVEPQAPPATAEAVAPAPPEEILLGEPPPPEVELVPLEKNEEPLPLVEADSRVEPDREPQAPAAFPAGDRTPTVTLPPLEDFEEVELTPVEDLAGAQPATPPGEGGEPARPVAVVAEVETGGDSGSVVSLEEAPLEPEEAAGEIAEEHETPWDFVQMLFPELEPVEFEIVRSVTKLRELPPGEVLVREGEEGDSLFIVTQGLLEARGHFDGNEVLLAALGPGDILGEVAFLKNVPRTATVTAVQPSTVLELPGEQTRRELSAHPGLLGQLEIILQERVYKTLSVLKTLGKNRDGDSQG